MNETGVGLQNLLFFIGVVENNVDERLEGRVQVRAFGVHGTNAQVPTEDLPWATLIHGSYDPDALLPPVNSFVFGFFLDGRDAQQPMILGLIPTQLLDPIDPDLNGWGAIPERDADLLARGSTPNDIGQPRNSPLGRGEAIDTTYVLQQAANQRRNIPMATVNPDDEDERQTFSEPAPAYNAEYPYNRVIRSGRNSIELDDTPGAERITIFHQNSGSYISIDTRGTTVYRSMSDTYNINEHNYNVYIGGQSNVTVEGDSRVLVNGNKVEEVTGDLIQNVRGNYLLSVAGQSNFNAGNDMQIRASKIRMEANVENVSIKAGKSVSIQGGEGINLKGKSVNVQGDTLYLTAEGALDVFGGHVKLGGGAAVSVSASLVAIDDIIQLSSGESTPPEAASIEDVGGTEMPEPVSAAVSVTAGENRPSLGSSGYASTDDPDPENDFSDEERENDDISSIPENLSLTEEQLARVSHLRNDPDFQRELRRVLDRYPNLTEDQIYGTIIGESGGNPREINTRSNGLYGGLFQLGQASVGLSPQEVASRTPAQQMRLYGSYLDSIGYRGGGLGMYQAAPGVVSNYASRTGQVPPDNLILYIPRQYTQAQIRAIQEAGYITDFASRQFGNVVLAQNSAGRSTEIRPGTGWVEAAPESLQRLGIPGLITVGQVNGFYRR